MFPKFELAPIRTYLRMLQKTFRPSITPSSHDQEALLEEDDVGGLLGDVDRGVDRDPDVRDAQRRRIVDAVAEKPDDVLARLQHLNDALLVPGRHAREERGPFRRLGQLLVGHLLDLAPEQHVLGGDADDPANRPADEVVVAREDLHGDAELPRAPVIAARAVSFGGSRKATYPARVSVGLVVLRVRGARLEIPVPERQHAKTLAGERVVFLAQVLAQDRLDRVNVTVERELRAAREDRLRGALADEPVLALRRLDDDGHQSPREVERELVDLAPVGDPAPRRARADARARPGRGRS